MKKLAVLALVAIAPLAAFAGGDPLLAHPTTTELEAVESVQRKQAELNRLEEEITADAAARLRELGLKLEGWNPKARAWCVTEIAPASSATPAPITSIAAPSPGTVPAAAIAPSTTRS